MWNNQPCGSGKEYDGNGGSFVGYFFEGKYHGKGVVTYANNDRIEGTWWNDKPEGSQYFYSNEGWILKSKYRDGLKIYSTYVQED